MRFSFSGASLMLALASVLCACSSGSTAPVVPAVQQNAGAAPPLASPGGAFASGRRELPPAADYNVQLMPALHSPSTVKSQSVVYPGDLQYNGGRVLPAARVINIFVNSSPATFGSPNSFEEHLSYSTFSHVTDQYVHAKGDNRYDWEGDTRYNYEYYGLLSDEDMLGIVHSVASSLHKTGYAHIYNIFLAPGVNICFTGTTSCNASVSSPFPAFCAYHGSQTFQDIGHVLFTVQPYQDPNYCAQPSDGPTPNGVNDNTYSTLSHELFETITDPNPGSGWIDTNVGVHGEIGDLCAYLPATMNLDNKLYYLQREYSNYRHGCVDANL